MQIYVCDRCGKNIGIAGPSVKKIGICFAYIPEGRDRPKNDKRSVTRKDLCNTCQEQLEQWWREGESK